MPNNAILDTEEIVEHASNKYHLLQKPREFTKFLDLITYRDPKTIFEIGVSLGGSLWAMAAALQGPRTFVSIDLPGGPFGGSGITDDKIKNLVVDANPKAKCRVIRGDSKTVHIPAGVVPDLVFIDGDHTYEGVLGDWNRFWPMMHKGSMIAFHDIVEHPVEKGVQVDMLWDELCASNLYNTHEIIEEDSGPWAGIGIIYF